MIVSFKETCNLVEELEKNPNSSGAHKNSRASSSVFKLFCQLNEEKSSLNQDERTLLKNLIRERSRSFGTLLADMDSKFGFFEGFDE